MHHRDFYGNHANRVTVSRCRSDGGVAHHAVAASAVNNVDRLTQDVEQKLGTARATLGVLDSTTGGDCKKVGQTAPGNVRDAVETIAAEAKRRHDKMQE